MADQVRCITKCILSSLNYFLPFLFLFLLLLRSLEASPRPNPTLSQLDLAQDTSSSHATRTLEPSVGELTNSDVPVMRPRLADTTEPYHPDSTDTMIPPPDHVAGAQTPLPTGDDPITAATANTAADTSNDSNIINSNSSNSMYSEGSLENVTNFLHDISVQNETFFAGNTEMVEETEQDLYDDSAPSQEDYNWLLDYENCSASAALMRGQDEGLADEDNPSQDKTDLKEAWGNIMEHVMGDSGTPSDPEDVRVRAYVVTRRLHHHHHHHTHDAVVQPGHFTVIYKENAENDVFDVGLEDSIPTDKNSHAEDVDEEQSEKGEGQTQVDKEDEQTGKNNKGEERDPEDDEEEKTKGNNEGKRTEVTVEEGARLRLVCNVTGITHFWVEWRRAANLTFPGGSEVVGGGSVLLDYVGREDAGDYLCTARNPRGHTRSTALTIHVHYAPVVGVWALDLEDSGLELGCLVEAQPHPAAAWYKNNTRLSSSFCPGNVEMWSSMLSPGFTLSMVRINNVTQADFAYYHCRAINTVGVSRAYVMVHNKSGLLNLSELKPSESPKYSTPVENPRLASFLLGMVPPLYIGLYIIAYLGCYKTPLSGHGGGHGRFGASVDLETE